VHSRYFQLLFILDISMVLSKPHVQNQLYRFSPLWAFKQLVELKNCITFSTRLTVRVGRVLISSFWPLAPVLESCWLPPLKKFQFSQFSPIDRKLTIFKVTELFRMFGKSRESPKEKIIWVAGNSPTSWAISHIRGPGRLFNQFPVERTRTSETPQ
jgi:hypothetical protein